MKIQSDDSTTVSPLALRPRAAAAALSISERKLFDLRDELPPVKVGRTILYPVTRLQAWLDGQTAGQK